jgi:hypothetical protein
VRAGFNVQPNVAFKEDGASEKTSDGNNDGIARLRDVDGLLESGC